MTYNFTISPDFSPAKLSGWFIFNTWLQRQLGEGIHLDLYDDFDSQRRAINADKFDLIYANPFDATTLVREKGFVPIASPAGHSDEAVIAVAESSPVARVEELRPGLRVSSTDDPDVNMMCMIMLEPADLDKHNTIINQRDTYVLVAKDLIRGDADAGFFLADTYHKLSKVVRSQLRCLVQSEIQVISHVLLLGPALAHRRDDMQQLLGDMSATPAGAGVLESLGIEAWNILESEDTEFMIDLMDTLDTE